MTWRTSPKPLAAWSCVPTRRRVVAIAAPDDFKETSPDDFLTVAIAARDDVAVASAELHCTIERSAWLDRPGVGERRRAARWPGDADGSRRGRSEFRDARPETGRRDLVPRARDRQPAGPARSQRHMVVSSCLADHRALRVAAGPPGNGRSRGATRPAGGNSKGGRRQSAKDRTAPIPGRRSAARPGCLG